MTSTDNSVINGSSVVESSVAESSVVESSVDSNGSNLKNGEFSDEEEDEDESQPSIVVRKATTPLRLVDNLFWLTRLG